MQNPKAAPCQGEGGSDNIPESELAGTSAAIQTSIDDVSRRPLSGSLTSSPRRPIQQMLIGSPSTIQHFLPPTLSGMLLDATSPGKTVLAASTPQIPALASLLVVLQRPVVHSNTPTWLLPPLSPLLLRIHEQIAVVKPFQPCK